MRLGRKVGGVVLVGALVAMGCEAPFVPTYENPLPISMAGGRNQTSCADPTALRSPSANDPYWYAYCTSDPLTDDDVSTDGTPRRHLLPGLRSPDLTSWERIGDAFAALPSWAAPEASLWAPELVFRDGGYFLYFAVTDVTDAVSGEPGCASDSAIGVATSDAPGGPWTFADAPVVAPRRDGPGCAFEATLDPDVLALDDGRAYLYYGSYRGGIEARPLGADGLSTAPETAVPITVANRYEAPEVVRHGGAYYLLVSASDCCRGPLTGYQVFAGRAASPLGPFVDAEGVSLLGGQVGGSPVLVLNGGSWVGTGHGTFVRDDGGNDFLLYHGIDRQSPYFAGTADLTRRPLLLDRLTWDGGFPRVRRGLGASTTPQIAPVASGMQNDPRLRSVGHALNDAADPKAFLLTLDELFEAPSPVPAYADELDGDSLSPAWSWIRPRASGVELGDGVLRLGTQDAELFEGENTASLLTMAAPPSDYVVETKMTLDVPPHGCCHNYVQAGLVVYGGDDAYVKLVHVSIWETRQIEFAKEVPNAGSPRYGSSVGGPAGTTTWLRIAKVTHDAEDHYVAYSSRDGRRWTRGATWTHDLGPTPRIGLVAFGGAGFSATFEHVRVHRLGSRSETFWPQGHGNALGFVSTQSVGTGGGSSEKGPSPSVK